MGSIADNDSGGSSFVPIQQGGAERGDEEFGA